MITEEQRNILGQMVDRIQEILQNEIDECQIASERMYNTDDHIEAVELFITYTTLLTGVPEVDGWTLADFTKANICWLE